MAKDGTNRGGARIGAGRKRQALKETIAVEMNHDFKIPEPKTYLSEGQKGGGKTCAEQIYRETYDWLASRDCAESVNPQLVEAFAQAMARHIQAEESVSKAGFLARHPTPGESMANPLIRISLDYLKSAQASWYQIQQLMNNFGDLEAGAVMNLLALSYQKGMK